LLDRSISNALYTESLDFSYQFPENAEVVERRAFCYYQLHDYETAIPLYLKHYSMTRDERSLVQAASCYFHLGQSGKSEELLSRVQFSEDHEELNADAAYLRAQIAIKRGGARQSLEIAHEFAARHRGHRYGDLLIVQAYYNGVARGARTEALRFLRGVRTYLKSSYYKAWAAYVLGVYGDRALLMETMLIRPDSYYSLRAAELLQESLDGETLHTAEHAGVVDSLRKSSLYRFLYLGLYDELEEIASAGLSLSSDGTRREMHYLLSRVSYARGDVHNGVRHAEKLFAEIGVENRLLLPVEMLSLLYPRAYCEYIDQELGRSEEPYDKYLVLAIIREESRYDPNAASGKGAVGLMQLMPSTASWILKNDVPEEKLLDPEVSISAGTAYLDYLFGRFSAVEHVIAAYNGGPNIVARWLTGREDGNIERFIEEIPYRETRNFVKKVYTSYRIYTLLYEDN
jgi:soluble lytic murein transglycosylase